MGSHAPIPPGAAYAVLGALLSLKHELRVMLPRRQGSIVNV